MKSYLVKKLSEVATISRVRKGGVYPKGCTLIQVSATSGEVCCLEQDSSVDSKYVVIQSLGLNDKYLNVILNKNISKFIHNYKQGLNISKTDLQYLPIEILSDDLIKKLTNVIWLVNQLMDNIQSEIELLKELKKGFLQKMFPKNGAKVPETRFPGFTEDWEQRKVGEILVLLKDGTHGTHKDVDEGMYLLSAKNIKNGQINIDESDRIISEDEYKSIHKNFNLEKGDVLLTIVGSIGEAAVLENPFKLTFQRSVAYLRPNGTLTSQFLYTTIMCTKFQRELKKRQVVSAQPGIYLGDLSMIPIELPCMEEQQKIGTFFKQLENTITLHQRKLDLLKETKKGFLQKMFV